ncbi:ATP-binding protein, partial [bacterium]
MPALNFNPQPATKKNSRLKLALTGPSGSGKTFTALSIAAHLLPDPRIVVIDTEHGSASLYAKEFTFDVFHLEDHDPRNYVECIRQAVKLGYDIIIIDSLSHAWNGTNGALEMVDNASKKSGNGFGAWRDV